MKRLTAALFALAATSTNVFAAEFRCTHFWITEQNGKEVRIASGKAVGTDVGESQYGPRGVYECQVSLSPEEVKPGHYLFIGEVGDASYLTLKATPAGEVPSPIVISHGWSSSDTEHPRYLRFLPFYVPSEYLFSQPGNYRFELFYTDIIPLQTGLRSGPPSLETASGLTKRIWAMSGGTIFQLIQCFGALLATGFFAMWAGVPARRRWLLGGASFFASIMFLSFSALPRFLFSPDLFSGLHLSTDVAVRINDVSVIVACLLVNLSIFCFTEEVGPKLREKATIVFAGGAIISIVILSVNQMSSPAYIPLYGASLAIVTSALPAFFALGILSERLVFSHSPTPRARAHSLFLIAKGLAFAWDIVDLVWLQARYPFICHYFYLSISLFQLVRMQLVEIASDKWFRERLENHRQTSVYQLGNKDIQASHVFNALALELSITLHSERLGLGELVDGGHWRFVGFHGNFNNVEGLQEITVGSIVARTVELKAPQSGSAARKDNSGGSKTLTEYWVIPLVRDNVVIGWVSATDFKRSRLMPFFKRRLTLLTDECSILFSLLLAEKKTQTQSKLVQMNRLRIHPLQLESENYFLQRFELSDSMTNPAFIMGDLVGSTDLNEAFGARAVRSSIDEHLREAFERFRHFGAIFNRDKGDAISILIPNQKADKDPSQAVTRAFEVMAWLSDPNGPAQEIARKHGIVLPFRYRLAMSVANVAVHDQGKDALAGFTLLADANIDAAARVLSDVALEGEAIVLEPAFNLLAEKTRLIALPPQRLRGKKINIPLYLLGYDDVAKAS